MNIGNSPAFPKPYAGCDGMTYRMWLIGMIAGGFYGNTDLQHCNAGNIIHEADLIIEALERENNRVEGADNHVEGELK